jgi:hypothetical protein
VSPPVPIAGEYAGRNALITFDKDLVDQALSAANWVLHLDPSGTLGAEEAEVIPPNQVALGFAVAAEGLSLEYLATPPDVVGAPPNNLAVVAFSLLL